MPYGATLSDVLTIMLTTSIVLVREGTAQTAQLMHIEFMPAGTEQVPGQGSEAPGDGGGSVVGSQLKVYGAADADMEPGDQFVHDGIQYRLSWVGPQGRNFGFTSPSGRMAYAEAWE